MINCEVCNLPFKNGQGIAGHKRMKHGVQQPAAAAPDHPAAPAPAEDPELAPKVEVLGEQMEKIWEAMPEPIDEDALAQKIATHLDQELSTRHPAGWCDNPTSCPICSPQERQHTTQVVDTVEARIPGTKEALRRWDLLEQEFNPETWQEDPTHVDELDRIIAEWALS